MTSNGILQTLLLVSFSISCVSSYGADKPKKLEQAGPVNKLDDTPNHPPSPAQAQVPIRPFPKWESIKPDNSVRLFPVMTDGKRTYVSLYGDGSTVSWELEGKISEVHQLNSGADHFYIDGELAKRVLEELKIPSDEVVYWFLFDRPEQEQLAVQKVTRLIVKPNSAAGGVFGALGVEVSRIGSGNAQTSSAIGLASVGKISQLSPSMGQTPRWSSTNLDLPTEKVIDQADFIAPLGGTGSRQVKESFKSEMIRFGEMEFIQIGAKFETKWAADQADFFSESMYGYFLKHGSSTKTVYDFYLDTTYFQKPEKILIGEWVKGFDASLYISSTGMGDCGRFVLFRKGVEPTVVPVRCGSWGC